MKNTHYAALFLSLLVTVFLLGFMAPVADAAQPTPSGAKTEGATKSGPSYLRLLTGPNGGQWFEAGEVIAVLFDRDIMPTTSRMGGGMTNISSIHSRMGDLGFTVASFLFGANKKLPEFEGMETENVATIGNIYPQVLYVLARKEFAEKNNITTIDDLLALKGVVRLASLRPGSASEFVFSGLLKYGYNTSFEELRMRGWTVSYGNYSAIADDLVAGTLDCFAYTAGEDVPLIHTLSKHIPIAILQVDIHAIESFVENFGMYAYTIPAHRYIGQDKPVTTLGDYTCMIVRKDFSDDLVYKIVKILYENKKFIAETVADFGALAAKTAVSNSEFLHPGAMRFWKEQQ